MGVNSFTVYPLFRNGLCLALPLEFLSIGVVSIDGFVGVTVSATYSCTLTYTDRSLFFADL